MGRMGPGQGPKGTVHIKWGQQKGLLKLCSGYLSPTSPHHRPDPGDSWVA